jgi:hypothetical protein
MHRHIRLLLTGLAATAILAAAVGTASAERLELSNQQIRVVWTSLELSNSINGNIVRCAVTLEGSFHSRTIAKIRDKLVGYITRANVQNNQCTGGRATILNETLPWHLTYQSFTETLPAIRTILLNLIRAGFIIEIPGSNNCKAITSTESPARGIVRLGPGGRVENLNPDPLARIPLVNGPGGFACGLATGSFEGTGVVTLLGTTNSISIRLI